MLDTVNRYMQGLANPKDAYFLQRILNALADRYSSQPLNSAGLVINAGGALIAKTGAADFYATAGGVLVKITAGTAMPALTGINTAAGGFNVACFFVDGAGTVTVAGGTPAATLAGVGWPQFPVGKALIGFLIITGAGAFTGGTTALDTATTVYISPTGPFDPTVRL
jgi:hypothetical protein